MPLDPSTTITAVSSVVSAGIAYLVGNRNQVSSILQRQEERITALMEDTKLLKASTDERIAKLEKELSDARVENAGLSHKLKTCMSNADYLKRERDEARAEVKKLNEKKGT